MDYFVGSDFDDIYSNVMKRMLSNDFAQSYSGHYFGADFNGCTNLDRSAWALLGAAAHCGGSSATPTSPCLSLTHPVQSDIAFLAAWVVLSMAFGALQALYTAKGVRPRFGSHKCPPCLLHGPSHPFPALPTTISSASL